MAGFLKSNYLILLVFSVVAIGVAAVAASSGNDAKSESVVASVSKVTSDGGVVNEKSKSGEAKTACVSDRDCRADDDAYCSTSLGMCQCSDFDEIYSPIVGCYDSWDDDVDDGVKVAAGIIITLAVLIPLIIIGSIVACCCCCAGCAGHAWRQRRNQPPQTQVFVAGAYDQHGNPIQYSGPPPVYVQNPNNGPAPYPIQQQQQPQPHYENQYNNQKQNS